MKAPLEAQTRSIELKLDSLSLFLGFMLFCFLRLREWVAGGLVCSEFWSFHINSQKVYQMVWVLVFYFAFNVRNGGLYSVLEELKSIYLVFGVVVLTLIRL